MNFKKLLSLSVSFVLCACAPVVKNTPKRDATPVKEVTNFRSLPELKVCYDTIYVTDVNKLKAAGTFVPSRQTVHVCYFMPGCTDSIVEKWCQLNNSYIPQTARHEMEHARKCHLVKNTNQYTPYVRSKIAAMNEIMAPCGEIIQTVDDHWTRGIPCPQRKILQYSDSVIINAHENSFMKFGNIDFTNPRVADAVLNYGINKFLADVKRGVYIHTIRKYRDDPVFKNIEPNNQCDMYAPLTFCPQYDMWGPLFTYDTDARQKVDVWRHASPKTRMRVIHSVDSLIQNIYGPGYMLYMYKGKKIR